MVKRLQARWPGLIVNLWPVAGSGGSMRKLPPSLDAIKRRPSLEQNLLYLHEVVEKGSMRAAADHLGVAVSSISRRIALLERQLGLPVLERSRRIAKPTEAGALLLEFHRERLAQRDRLEQRLADVRGSRSGRVRIAVGEGLIGDVLASMLAQFLRQHSGIAIDVRLTMSSSEAARLVAEDEVHLGLAFHAAQDPRVRIAGSASQSICVVLPSRHRLARNSSLHLRDLEDCRLCLPDPSFRTTQLVRTVEIAEQCNLRPSVASNSIALLKALVRSGEFCTVLPELAVHEEVTRGEFATVPLAGEGLPDTSIHVLCRVGRQLPPAAQIIARSLAEFLRACVSRIERARRSQIEMQREPSFKPVVAERRNPLPRTSRPARGD